MTAGFDLIVAAPRPPRPPRRPSALERMRGFISDLDRLALQAENGSVLNAIARGFERATDEIAARVPNA